MHKTGSQAVDAASRLKGLVKTATDVEVMIAPTLHRPLPGGADPQRQQHRPWGHRICSGKNRGAFTGKISAEMLVDAGCSHVIIGHSERRQFFGETDETVNRRIQAALAANLCPVFCIGESEAQREAGDTFSVLDKQVRVGLKSFVSDDLTGLVVAYEPVWAIGTGKTATREQAQEAHKFIRSLLDKLFGKPFAERPFGFYTEGV